MSETARWRCSVCGTLLMGERLEVVEDDGGEVVIYVVGCPDGHLHLAVTEPELVRFTRELVWARLNRP